MNKIQRENFPYILTWIFYYAWVVSFANWLTVSATPGSILSAEYINTMHYLSLIATGVFIFIIKKENFIRATRIGSAVIIFGIALFLIVPNPVFKMICVSAIGFAIGCLNASVLMPYVFILNNTEKILVVVLSNALLNFCTLFQKLNIAEKLSINLNFLPLSVLIVALSATLFFKKSSMPSILEEKDEESTKMNKSIYLSLVFNCIFVIICNGVGKSILTSTAALSSYNIYVWYYIAGILGCFISYASYTFSKKSFIWLGNISFACLAMGLLCNAFMQVLPQMAIAFAILFGIGGTSGMINMYYIIGVIGKKYNSMLYLKLSTIVIGFFGGITGVTICNVIDRANTVSISIMASIFSVSAIFLFMIASPIIAFATSYYSDLAGDSESTDVVEENRINIFEKYQLSKREIEVCELLLQGYTMRQIAAILSIAYSTVNTYCTSSYRKLNINSRTELLIMFKDYPS